MADKSIKIESIIKKVWKNENYYMVELINSWTFALDKKDGIIPKVGDCVLARIRFGAR
jgi:hypothetical protein